MIQKGKVAARTYHSCCWPVIEVSLVWRHLTKKTSLHRRGHELKLRRRRHEFFLLSPLARAAPVLSQEFLYHGQSIRRVDPSLARIGRLPEHFVATGVRSSELARISPVVLPWSSTSCVSAAARPVEINVLSPGPHLKSLGNKPVFSLRPHRPALAWAPKSAISEGEQHIATVAHTGCYHPSILYLGVRKNIRALLLNLKDFKDAVANKPGSFSAIGPLVLIRVAISAGVHVIYNGRRGERRCALDILRSCGVVIMANSSDIFQLP